jgi:hypothetical protein
MHPGIQNNSYNINAQVNYELETIVKQKPYDKVNILRGLACWELGLVSS